MLPSLARFQPPGDAKPHLVQILADIIDNGSDLTSTEETNLIQLVSQLLQVYCVSFYHVRAALCIIACVYFNNLAVPIILCQNRKRVWEGVNHGTHFQEFLHFCVCVCEKLSHSHVPYMKVFCEMLIHQLLQTLILKTLAQLRNTAHTTTQLLDASSKSCLHPLYGHQSQGCCGFGQVSLTYSKTVFCSCPKTLMFSAKLYPTLRKEVMS